LGTELRTQTGLGDIPRAVGVTVSEDMPRVVGDSTGDTNRVRGHAQG